MTSPSSGGVAAFPLPSRSSAHGSSGASARVVGLPDDRANLYGRGRWALRGFHRLVDSVALDQVDAAELLLRLGERAVRDDACAILGADGLRPCGRVQLLAATVPAALREPLAERLVPRIHLRLLGLRRVL